MIKRWTLNNYSIKTKLIIIYAFCVLIPMMVTDSIVYFTISNHEIQDQRSNINHVIERVKYNLTESLEQCIVLSNSLYTDKNLNDLITTEYENPIDFYSKYNYMLENNIIRYSSSSQPTDKVNIYVDNDSIINSADIYKLTPEVRESNWYKQFCENDKKMTITLDFDDSKKYYSPDNQFRTISIVRKLNYFNSPRERIVKIDIDYNTLLGVILNEKMEENLYVCTDDLIVFSNKESSCSQNPFNTIDFIEKRDLMIDEDLNFNNIYGNWKIIIAADKVNLFSKISKIKDFLIILIVCNLLVPTIVITLVSSSLRKRVSILDTHLGKVENEEFNVIKCDEGKDEIGRLIRSYNMMVLKIKELIEVVFKEDAEKKTLELAKKQAELKAFQSQVNPHFLFNTLESIRMRSLIKDEGETAGIIEKLSILLRTTINWGEDYISIVDEMLFVENYLQIQKYRFGDKLSFSSYIMDNCKKIKIPKLTILSFVENACVHGIEEVAHDASISVSVFKDDKYLYIEISDSGKGMKEDELLKVRQRIKDASIEMFSGNKGVGILNSYIRLKIYFNNNIQLEINSEDEGGTDITLQIAVEELRKRGELGDD